MVLFTSFFFFFNDTATTEIYTLSLHDALPIRAVYGGLHLPVHALRTPLLLQSTLGNPNPPWRPIGERDVASAIAEITARGPALVALSSHDSTPWTYGAFAQAFGDRYRTLQVGDELRVSSAGATWGTRRSTT